MYCCKQNHHARRLFYDQIRASALALGCDRGNAHSVRRINDFHSATFVSSVWEHASEKMYKHGCWQNDGKMDWRKESYRV